MAHQARKRFGQNFLKDPVVISQILACAQIQSGQHWVEIGPGLGALTGPLLKTGVQLEVIELDRDLVTYLHDKFSRSTNLTIHSADALEFAFTALVQPGEKLRVIGNLPYNISTPLLFHLLSQAPAIADMHFMLQKEVVDRICAAPGSKTYGRLSIMMQYYCAAEWVFDVPPESFEPAPKVMSAIVRLIPHPTIPDHHQAAALSQLVTQAFSQRRKTLRNALSKMIPEDAFPACGIDPGLRPEMLDLEAFLRLTRYFVNQKETMC